MGMIIYKGEIQGEGTTGVEIYVKDISEIEMGDKTENGYKIEPKIVEGDLGEKTYQYNIPLGMIIGNSAIVGSDQQSFVIPKKEAPVDIELSNGSRATFGESANRFVAQGLRIIAANSKNIEDIDIQPEDLYTKIGTIIYSSSSTSSVDNYNLYNQNIHIISKSSTNPCKITIGFGENDQWLTGTPANLDDSYEFTLDSDVKVKNIGVCFISTLVTDQPESKARIFAYLVIIDDRGKKYCHPIHYRLNGSTPYFNANDTLDNATSDIAKNDCLYFPFASQAEYDFACGITNSYSYMTYEEYKAALQS